MKSEPWKQLYIKINPSTDTRVQPNFIHFWIITYQLVGWKTSQGHCVLCTSDWAKALLNVLLGVWSKWSAWMPWRGVLFLPRCKKATIQNLRIPNVRKKRDTILIFIFIMWAIQFSWITAFGIRFQFHVVQSGIFCSNCSL